MKNKRRMWKRESMCMWEQEREMCPDNKSYIKKAIDKCGERYTFKFIIIKENIIVLLI